MGVFGTPAGKSGAQLATQLRKDLDALCDANKKKLEDGKDAERKEEVIQAHAPRFSSCCVAVS